MGCVQPLIFSAGRQPDEFQRKERFRAEAPSFVRVTCATKTGARGDKRWADAGSKMKRAGEAGPALQINLSAIFAVVPSTCGGRQRRRRRIQSPQAKPRRDMIMLATRAIAITDQNWARVLSASWN
jgi:hypothetical protein